MARCTSVLIPIALFLVIGNSPVQSAPGNPQPGKLKLTILESDSGQPTPARVELQDSKGQGYVAEDALPAGCDCEGMGKEPEWDTLEEAITRLSKKVQNTYTGTVQFYSAGQVETSLPPGAYQLRVFKGIEYQAQTRQLKIRSNETTEFEVKMTRWVNMPEQGWFGADDHLHIARPVEGLNPFISKIMQAEDIHVANLLQMGFYRHNITLQYAHGPGSIYQKGHYILASGQENPRTHFLGHAITLGAHSEFNFPENYVIYRLFWEEAHRQGGLSGYAHFGTTTTMAPPSYGLAVDLPHGLLSFLEVLQFNRGVYEAWYEILNTGFRITPTAGTDYPCVGASIPGRERFYTKVEGPLTYENWLEGVRRGRTFVSNGPNVEFQVDDKGMGEEVVLEQAGPVKVRGRVHFDPSWDDIERLDVIENGRLLKSFPRTGDSSEIRFQFDHPVAEASWLAIRASGKKRGEVVARNGPTGVIYFAFEPTSEAHSAPIYVSLNGGPPLSAHPRAKALARTWLARLDDLESRLALDEDGNLALERPLAPRRSVETGLLRRNRSALLEEIQKARDYFTRLAR